MNKIFLLLLIISITVLACKEEPQVEYRGTITGYDLRMCVCCGGIIIEIDNATYRFESYPTNSGFDISKDSFPINVIVTWHKKSNPCLGDEIVIDKIRKL